MRSSIGLRGACGGLLCLILVSCGGGGEAGAGAGDTAAIAAIEQRMGERIAARDAAGLAEHYAADAAIIFPGGRPVEGRAAIAKSYEAMLSDPAFALETDAGRVAVSGDLGYIRGTYRTTYTDPGSRRPASEAGNYITLFRRQPDGSWKVVEDMSSPGGPLPEVLQTGMPQAE